MIITAIAAISKNGLITNGNDSHVGLWTSPEDKLFFREAVASHNLLFIGRATYQAVAPNIKLSSGRMRIVFTKDPQKYEGVTGKLVFTSKSPKAVVAEYALKGYKKAALLGGSGLYSSFLQSGLINELYLTVEPVEFSSGIPLFSDANALDDFKLVSQKPLNASGTMLKYYVKL